MNPHAGRKLGLPTNFAPRGAVETALAHAGLRFEVHQTRWPGHATELARQAIREGSKLVIAAGGDGTVAEVGEALIDTDVVLGIMPLGSLMNMARTLCVPRDLPSAARAIARGYVLSMDVGRVNGRVFLEAGGVGLAAGLFGYFNRLDSGQAQTWAVLRALWRFLRHLRNPHLIITADGRKFDVRAPQVTVSNAPYVGAAYVLAPDARVDDGYLDVVIFRDLSVFRVLMHMLAVGGGRRLPEPPSVQLVRARSVEVRLRRRRPLPVHADGNVVGVTPARFEVLPGALRVIVGDPHEPCAWDATEYSRPPEPS